MTETKPSHSVDPQPIDQLRVQKISFDDVRQSIAYGWSDFLQQPLLSGFFGAVYAFGGIFILISLLYFEQIWMIIPVALGFPLIAPFVAAGLYEISRRIGLSEPYSSSDIFLIIRKQPGRELGWMAFVVLFLFWIWIYQVRLLLAVFLGFRPFSSLEAFFDVVLGTAEGFLFIGIGTLVGSFLALVLFSLTVISMPLLLDKEIDFISAMLLSIRTVATNPGVMLAWGCIIAVLAIAAMLPLFLGLIVVLPVLGHTTWHLYKRAIVTIDANV
ncbi:MAG: DUF2189 domain-containing protein [Hyphomicrobiales bacterium]